MREVPPSLDAEDLDTIPWYLVTTGTEEKKELQVAMYHLASDRGR